MPRLRGAEPLYGHFQKAFQTAVEVTGDYETLFYPYEKDWAGPLIFTDADVVRHPLVARIVRAYEVRDERLAGQRETRRERARRDDGEGEGPDGGGDERTP